jgi:hypothetical protein
MNLLVDLAAASRREACLPMPPRRPPLTVELILAWANEIRGTRDARKEIPPRKANGPTPPRTDDHPCPGTAGP